MPPGALPAAPKSGSPPPFPLVANPAAPPPARKFPPPPAAAIPHVRAPVGPASEDSLPPRPQARRKTSRPALLAALLAIVLLAAGATYFFVLREEPPPEPPVAVAKRPPAKADTPSETLNKIAAIPGQAIAKAQDVIAARRANEQDRVDAIVEGEDPPDARALATPPPSTFTPANNPAPITATSQLAPGVTATTSASTTAAAADASPAFRSWVANARINGVFQGNPARALINGRTFRAGQTLDAELGIVFVGLTDDAKSIVFRDTSGATVTRRF